MRHSIIQQAATCDSRNLIRKPWWKMGQEVGNLFTGYRDIVGLATPQRPENRDFIWACENLFSSPANPYILAISTKDGKFSGQWTITGEFPTIVANVTQLGSATVDGVPYLFFCMLGSSTSGGAPTQKVVRVVEPIINGASGGVSGAVYNLTTVGYTLTGGYDASIIDPDNGDLYYFSKVTSPITCFKAPFKKAWSIFGEYVNAEYLGTLVKNGSFSSNLLNTLSYPSKYNASFPEVFQSGYCVGAAISPNGTEILLKSFDNIYAWRRNKSKESIYEALTRPPDAVLTDTYVGGGGREPPYFAGVTRLKTTHPSQDPEGHALCFGYNGLDFYTCSQFDDNMGSSETDFPLFKYERVLKEPTTVVLKQGTTGAGWSGEYTGCWDLYYNSSFINTCFENSGVLQSFNKTSPEIIQHSLIRFNCYPIPTGATVIGGHLDLIIGTGCMQVDLHRIMGQWDTGSTAASVQIGPYPGMQLDDLQVESTPYVRHGINSPDDGMDGLTGRIRFNLSPVVIRTQMLQPGAYQGFLINCPEYVGVGVSNQIFCYDSTASEELRPSLTVTYLYDKPNDPRLDQTGLWWMAGKRVASYESPQSIKDCVDFCFLNNTSHKTGFAYVTDEGSATGLISYLNIEDGSVTNGMQWSSGERPACGISSFYCINPSYIQENHFIVLTQSGTGNQVVFTKFKEEIKTMGSVTNKVARTGYVASGNLKAIMTDQDTNDVYCITRDLYPCQIYKLDASDISSWWQALPIVYTIPCVGTVWTGINTMTYGAPTAAYPSGVSGYIVGGTMSPNGDLILLKSFEKVYAWSRRWAYSTPDEWQIEAVETALAREPDRILDQAYVGGGYTPFTGDFITGIRTGIRALPEYQEPCSSAISFDNSGNFYTVSKLSPEAGPATVLFKYTGLNLDGTGQIKTVEFQQGLSGYEGCIQASIDQADSDDYYFGHPSSVDYGTLRRFIAGPSYSVYDMPKFDFIKFDLTSIPSGSKVVGQHLDLFLIDGGTDFTIHKMISGWEEFSSWETMIYPAQFLDPGPGFPFNDSGASILSGFSAGMINTGNKILYTGSGLWGFSGWYRCNLAPDFTAIQDWINNPSSNSGFLLRGGNDGNAAEVVMGGQASITTAYYNVLCPETGKRPKLVVSYISP